MNSFIKRCFASFVVGTLLLSGGLFISAQHSIAFAQEEKKVTIEVFEREECKHCKDEKTFLNELAKERDDFTVNLHDITDEKEKILWERLTTIEKLPKATPVTVIGTTVIQGFDTAETTGERFKALIDAYKGKEVPELEAFIEQGGSGSAEAITNGTCDDKTGVCDATYVPYLVNVPFLGAIDVKQYSLPTLSIILGFVDGFNPCAMWVLVTFLIALTQVGDRKRMWQIAGLFIAAETIMYYMILNVWFTAWDFVGLDAIITPIVGLVAIGGGCFFLYEGITSDGTCKVTNLEQRSKTSKKINLLAEAEWTIFTVLGVIGLALSVNIIEFACSIGIPQAFTKILDINALSFLEQQFYMFLYILFYMIDDFIVFGIALYSIEKIGLTTKYSKYSNLIGGVLMITLGLILIFVPEWLVL